MKIIYMSGAMKDADFNIYIKKARYNLNPSNQNFHYRFLKSLASQAEIIAITLRPFSKGLFEVSHLEKEKSIDGQITFNYLADKANRFYRLFLRHRNLVKEISTIIKEQKDDIVLLVDSLKYALAKAAIKAAKKNKIKVIAIVTDNPKLLSNESLLYAKAIATLNKKYDGFVTLSPGLNELTNKKAKPSYIFSGFAEEITIDTPLVKEPYFFCCGALYERYGILKMIEAFKQVKTDRQLLIAGHGPMIETIKQLEKDDPRIRYVGLLSREQVLNYESHSELNINPRLFSEDIDKYSVPSKVLEYLSSGVPLLSTIHTALHQEFCGEVIWIKDGTSDELRKAMELFLAFQNGEMKKKALLAKEKVLSKYGLEVQGKLLYEFITSVSSFSIN
jgi:glycosyltransferase involved in cell wall biosynthesis